MFGLGVPELLLILVIALVLLPKAALHRGCFGQEHAGIQGCSERGGNH